MVEHIYLSYMSRQAKQGHSHTWLKVFFAIHFDVHIESCSLLRQLNGTSYKKVIMRPFLPPLVNQFLKIGLVT